MNDQLCLHSWTQVRLASKYEEAKQSPNSKVVCHRQIFGLLPNAFVAAHRRKSQDEKFKKMFNGETVLTILSQVKINSNDVGVISSTFENLEAV